MNRQPKAPLKGGRKTFWSAEEVFDSHDFPFGITTAEPQPPDILHSHRGFSELTVIHRGEGVHVTEDEAYEVRAGDVWVIHGSFRHGYRDVRDLHLKNINFDSKRMLIQSEYVKRLPGYHVLFELEPRFRRAHQFTSRLHLQPDQLRHLRSLVEAMEEELAQRPPGFEYTVTALFMQAVSFVCRCYGEGGNSSTRALMRMACVISHIEANYADDIALADLCAIAGLSTSVLLKNFKEATGVPPIDYLIRVRVARAIELMREPDTTITDAAFAVGFSDSNYFSRQFRRIMGTSPSEYRERTRHLPMPHPPSIPAAMPFGGQQPA